MKVLPRPRAKPANPRFSSGPCPKRPGWSLDALKDAALGRSHRVPAGRRKLEQALALTREVLQVPHDFKIAIVPASDTGAVEAALWSLLGPRPVDVLAFDSFSRGWAHDIEGQLKIAQTRLFEASCGGLPDLAQLDFAHDLVFAWNGTSCGVRIPNADFIPRERAGLTICDATSAAFAQRLDFTKLDATTFSWQKVLGGEAAHGMLILSPRAIARLESYRPPWPMPKIFRLAQEGRVNESIFDGHTINTPSLLCVEDYLDALGWAKSIGGLDALIARADRNAATIADWIENGAPFAHLVKDPALRSNTSVCLDFADPAVAAWPEARRAAFAKEIVRLVEAEDAGYDFGAYRTAPPGLRIWCGGTVEAQDLALLTQWIDWAYAEALRRLE